MRDAQRRETVDQSSIYARRPLLTAAAMASGVTALLALAWLVIASSPPVPTCSGDSGSQSGCSTGGPVGLGSPVQFFAKNTTNALGGCAAPGPGKTEYCYSLAIVDSGGGLSTQGLRFYLETPTGNLTSLVNVTLLDSGGSILAGYSTARGWFAYGNGSLPVMVNTAETLVVNVGGSSVTGDSFYAQWNGPLYATTSVTLP